MGPAHIMYSKEEAQTLQGQPFGIKSMREKVESSHSPSMYSIKFEHMANKYLHVQSPPMVSYRYTYEEGEGEAAMHRMCMNDIVLFKLDKDEATELQAELQINRITRASKLISINTMNILGEYNRPSKPIPIFIKNLSGVIVPNPISLRVHREEGIGYHILFQLREG